MRFRPISNGTALTRFVAGVALLAASATMAFAQEEHSAPMQTVTRTRLEAPEADLPPSLASRQASLTPFRMPALTATDVKRTDDGGRRRIGKTSAFQAAQAKVFGRWGTSASARPNWRMEVADDSAVGLRIHFRNFDVRGGRVWVHNGDAAQPQTLGPFTSKGTFGDGDFWTGIVFGSRTVIEYEPEVGAPESEAPPFTIFEVVQMWEFLNQRSQAALQAQVDTSCLLDAQCYTINQPIADALPSVVYLVIGNSQCTGTILSDKGHTKTPFLLTAGHCVTSVDDARGTTAYWGYQTNGCGGLAPNIFSLASVTGGQLLNRAHFSGGLDYAFLQLSAQPNATWSLAGWDTTEVNPGEALDSISHPRNLPKRFARASRTGEDAGDVYGFDVFQGRVDHGSSGSALFSPGAVVRAIDSFGANVESVSACSLGRQIAYWTRFRSIYPNIQAWLSNTTPPAQNVPADMQIPAPNSKLSGASTTFTWNAVAASEYFLYVGTSAGAKDLYAQNTGSAVSATVSGLPVDGRTLYVRLWSHLADGWYYKDYTYTAASGGGGGGGGSGPAAINSPAPNSTLSGSSATFRWNNVAASEYFVYVGTSAGGKELFSQNVGTALSVTVGGLPTDGSKIYVRMWSHLADGWYYLDTVYTAASGGGGGGGSGPAAINSPAPNSTLSGSSVTLRWNSVGASEYFVYVGTSVGGKELFSQNLGTAVSVTVGGLPADGSKIYVRMWSHLADGWYYLDYVYTAAGSGGGGGSGPAAINSPAPNSTLSGSSVTFRWNGVAASEYFVYVGTSAGGKELFSQNAGAALSVTVGGLPTDGSKIYVRMWSHLADGWSYLDYVYTAAGGGGGGPGPATISSPAPGSTFSGSSVTFRWNSSAAASEYFVYVGTTPGGKELFAQTEGTALSVTVGGLPTDGRTLYVRLWSHLPDGWYYFDTVYTAAGGGGTGSGPASLTSPQPGSTLGGSSATFAWNRVASSEYVLYVGNSLGGKELHSQSAGTSLSATVNGLPTDGRTLYVRIWSHLADAWYHNDAVYTAARR